jgi:hypothetical protein
VDDSATWPRGIKTRGRSVDAVRIISYTPPTNLPVMNLLLKVSAVLALVTGYVAAESHTISFDNRSVVSLVGSKKQR